MGNPSSQFWALMSFSICTDSRAIPFHIKWLVKSLLSWTLWPLPSWGNPAGVRAKIPWEVFKQWNSSILPNVFFHTSEIWREKELRSQELLPKRGVHGTRLRSPRGFGYTLKCKRIQVNSTLPLLEGTLVFSLPNQIPPMLRGLIIPIKDASQTPMSKWAQSFRIVQ